MLWIPYWNRWKTTIANRASFIKAGAQAFSLSKAIEAIVTNDSYRLELAKSNYKAATAHPMSQIADLYLENFNKIIDKKSKRLATPSA